MFRSLIAGSALLALLATALPSRATAATPPVEINVILSLTGSSSFIGTTEQQSLAVIQKIVNERGGINGAPVAFTISDDASNPQTTLQLVTGLVAKHAAVIIGPSFTSGCNAIAPLLERLGPVQYCLSPGIHATPGSFVFSAGAGTDATAATELRFFRERGITRIAMIALTDASGQDHETQIAAALRLPENKGMTLVASEHYNPTDVSVTAQLERIKAGQPQALITTATGVAFGTVLRNLADAGMDIPVTASAGNMSNKQMEQYKSFVPSELLFMATHGVAPDPAIIAKPLLAAQALYFKNLDAAGVQPSYLTSLAWDPALIVVDALRRVGANATPEQLHAYLTQMHGFSGINGTYDFRDSQRGIGANAVVTYRWDPKAGHFFIVPTVAGKRAK
jgi:branched-chain amino acid transport system substrate-binding protein